MGFRERAWGADPRAPRLPEALQAHCLDVLSRGSRSFATAGRLLGPALRERLAAVYAFCREADDAVDEAPSADAAQAALAHLTTRLDRVFAGQPMGNTEAALAWVCAQTGLPRGPFDFLLEGFAWDLEGRRYMRIEDLKAYCVRVASTVGVLCAWVLGAQRRFELERACDLGIAMQLTNIARDIGDDARQGRLYLPLDWCTEEGLDVAAWLALPTFGGDVQRLVRRLVTEAEHYYTRADQGLVYLPGFGGWSISAARLIYAGIHGSLEKQHYDSVSCRAFTSRRFKLMAALKALALTPQKWAHCPPEPSAAPLLNAIVSADR